MNKNVICIPFPDIKNAYVVISGYKTDTGNGVKKCMSFFYDNGNIGTEWEPARDFQRVEIVGAACNCGEVWFFQTCEFNGFRFWKYGQLRGNAGRHRPL